jgi:glutamyl-tRNA synthetase
VKDRCTLLTDFFEQTAYFFQAPQNMDVEAVKPKWNDMKNDFFIKYTETLNVISEWTATNIESTFKDLSSLHQIKPGELQLPMRIMLVGGKFGPAVFEIAAMIGKEATIDRIQFALSKLKDS